MKTIRFAALLISLAALCGCRARVVDINLTNTSTEAVKTIIVDYPSATFGKDKLGPNESYHDAIKVVDTGMLKLQYTDALGTIHTYTGTPLHKGDRGTIEVNLNQGGVLVKASLR
jgi:hypothetical protein